MDSRRISASDGTSLATDICLPDSHAGPSPAVVIRTPYDRRNHRDELRAWARRGFVALAQDVRGRHASQGRWLPYRGEAEDGASTLRWVRAQSWSNGQVVCAGASYGAYCALSMALGHKAGGQPDAVIAAVPALGLTETAREPSGPERLLARAGWWAAHGDRPDSDEDALARRVADDPALLSHLPLTSLPKRLGRQLPSWPSLWRAQRRGEVTRRGALASVPLLAVAGSADPFRDDTVELWRTWGGPARLVLGQWGHRLTADPAPGAGRGHHLNLGETYLHWARAVLGRCLAPGRRGVAALAGTNDWALMPEATEAAEPCRLAAVQGENFLADPSRPVRSDDLEIPHQTNRFADRCLLTTPPLPQPVEALGAAAVRLRAVAWSRSADWMVRVTTAGPSGVAQPLALGIVRRAGGPGQAAEFTVPLGCLASRLPAGSRLRVEIAGHHFPAHARNPHTGENPVSAVDLHASHRTIQAASLMLPLASGRRGPVRPMEEICR